MHHQSGCHIRRVDRASRGASTALSFACHKQSLYVLAPTLQIMRNNNSDCFRKHPPIDEETAALPD
jgi:hypothetical protein